MAYLIKALIGLVLFFGGFIIFNLRLQEVLDIGTCASGNVPFEIRPEYQCPEGTTSIFFQLVGSIFAMLIGGAVFAFRGDPPWGEQRNFGFFGLGTFAWGFFFAGTGLWLMLGGPYGEVVNDAGEVVGQPDSELGADITGITFLVMGVPALLIATFVIFKGLTGRKGERGPSGSSMPSMPSMPSFSRSQPKASKGGGDTIAKIERLQKLHESGALSKAEFDREKAKILAEQ